jgi:predicted GH43/DUF377 family glycosyl hydrolase
LIVDLIRDDILIGMKRSSLILCSLISISCISTDCADTGIQYDGGWIKHTDNPVLKPGRKTGASTNDYYNLSDCYVIKDSGVFKMWYTSSGPTSISSVNHCNISYATSDDGIEWTKYIGNPVLDIDPDSWDEYAVETVSILIDPDDTPDKRFKMWYAGETSNVAGNPAYDIGYAYSSDGINWIKYPSPVLIKGDSSQWDNSFIEGPCVIKDGALYRMWYAGMDAVANIQATDGKVCIGYATSPDGISWLKDPNNPVMMTGNNPSWDYRTVQDPHVIKYNGMYHMWYGGKTNDVVNYGQQTGYASSEDGKNWTKSSNNPVLSRGAAGQWDAVTASFGSVVIDNGKIKIWYTGMDKDYNPLLPEFWEIGYAEKVLFNDGIVE